MPIDPGEGYSPASETFRRRACSASISRSLFFTRPGGSAGRGVNALGHDACARGLDDEQEQQGDEQREDAERLRHREPKDQARELAVRRRGIAQSAGKVIGENQADADARPAHAETRKAGTDEFRSNG